jgi:cytochrome o ubiquinol oxidase subunit 2
LICVKGWDKMSYRLHAWPRLPAPVMRADTLFRGFLILTLATALSGCDWVVLNPAGDIARRQADLVLISTALMLLIIVPVMALTVLFAWRYRAANTAAIYDPDWDHSTSLELVIWTAPLAIVIALGSITWLATHLLDPWRPLARIDATHAIAPGTRPIEVDVVALDWKWLFIYPDQNLATVNELVLPEGRPVRFRITSSTVMNSFYVPALAGQIYAMPGMETRMNAVFNRTGTFTGFSANFSGAGFSHMRFATRSVTPAAFDAWAQGVHHGTGTLDRATYLDLDKPSEKVPVRHYAAVAPDLFDAVVNLCVRPGKLCSGAMAAIDARGGTGRAGLLNVAALTYDKQGREQVTVAAQGLAEAGLHRFVREWCADGRPLRAAVARDTLALRSPVS